MCVLYATSNFIDRTLQRVDPRFISKRVRERPPPTERMVGVFSLAQGHLARQGRRVGPVRRKHRGVCPHELRTQPGEYRGVDGGDIDVLRWVGFDFEQAATVAAPPRRALTSPHRAARRAAGGTACAHHGHCCRHAAGSRAPRRRRDASLCAAAIFL